MTSCALRTTEVFLMRMASSFPDKSRDQKVQIRINRKNLSLPPKENIRWQPNRLIRILVNLRIKDEAKGAQLQKDQSLTGKKVVG
jgi:hypothetical protein